MTTKRGRVRGRETTININHIRLSGVMGTLITVKMGKTAPAALVDTGATPLV